MAGEKNAGIVRDCQPSYGLDDAKMTKIDQNLFETDEEIRKCITKN